MINKHKRASVCVSKQKLDCSCSTRTKVNYKIQWRLKGSDENWLALYRQHTHRDTDVFCRYIKCSSSSSYCKIHHFTMNDQFFLSNIFLKYNLTKKYLSFSKVFIGVLPTCYRIPVFQTSCSPRKKLRPRRPKDETTLDLSMCLAKPCRSVSICVYIFGIFLLWEEIRGISFLGRELSC